MVVMTLIIVLGNVWFTTMAGYALAKFDFPGRSFLPFLLWLWRWWYRFSWLWHRCIWRLLISDGIIQCKVLRCLMCANVFMCFCTTAFFYSIPEGNGGSSQNRWTGKGQCIFRIVLPISKPCPTTIIILCFTGHGIGLCSGYVSDRWNCFPLW